jgi:hypothetical protein
MRNFLVIVAVLALSPAFVGSAQAKSIQHDAEYYILEAQNGELWAADDKTVDAKLAASDRRYVDV